MAPPTRRTPLAPEVDPVTTPATAPAWTPPGPGVYDGVPADVYHADPVPGGSLSSTGARRLLPPSCPARFAYERANPPAPKAVWDIGHAAHKLVLGVGPELVVVPGARWDTNAAKAAVKEARDAGKVPLKQADYDRVHDMAATLRKHPTAAALLHPAGTPEQSLFWQDPETGVWCRARIDWLPYFTWHAGSNRLIVPDYKTCASAALDDLQKAIHSHGYHQQADWYLRGLRVLFPDLVPPKFVFICQEKEPPYLVTVCEPDPWAMRIGAHLNREALHIYRECTESGRWPGYTDDVAMISLPGWVERQYEMELSQ